MKRILLFSISVFSCLISKAQEQLAPDQNPNYKVSMAKYQTGQEKILEGMGTTSQNTYKAYDWFEAKQQRKQDRLDFRRKLTLARVNSNRFTDYYRWRRRNVFFYR
jgi:hypothetical protein